MKKSVKILAFPGDESAPRAFISDGKNMLRVQTQPNTRYEILDAGNDLTGPQKIRAKRIGTDLFLTLDDAFDSLPDVILADYYKNCTGENTCDVTSKNVEGYVGAYVPYTDEPAFLIRHLSDDGESGQVLMNTAFAPPPPLALLGSAPAIATESGAGALAGFGLAPLLAGLGLLGAAAAAAAGGGGSGGNGSNGSGDSDKKVPSTPGASITDPMFPDKAPVALSANAPTKTPVTLPVVSGTGTPGDTIKVVTPFETLTTVVADDGKWSITPTVPLRPGANDLTVTATNANGTSAPAQLPVSVYPEATLDPNHYPNDPPSDTGTPGDAITANRMPIISNHGLHPATPGATITVETPRETLTTTVDANGQWYVKPTLPLIPGNQNLKVTAWTPASEGKPAILSDAQPVIFIVEGNAVSITRVTDDMDPIKGDIVDSGKWTNDTTPLVKGSLLYALQPGDQVQLFVKTGAEQLLLLGTVAVDASRNWQFQDDVTRMMNGATPIHGQFDPKGTLYTYEARIVDISGRMIATSAPFEINVKTEPPSPLNTVSITEVIDDATAITGNVPSDGVTNDTTPLLKGTLAARLLPSEYVELSRNGVVIGTATVTETTWAFQDKDLEDGKNYAYRATVKDLAGNTGATSNRYAISIDTSAPMLTADEASVTAAATASATPASITGNVLTNDDGNVGANTLTVTGAGTTAESISDTMGQVLRGVYGDLILNRNGTYTYTASRAGALSANDTRNDVFHYLAADKAGNVASQPTSITIKVTGVNDAPFIDPASIIISSNRALAVFQDSVSPGGALTPNHAGQFIGRHVDALETGFNWTVASYDNQAKNAGPFTASATGRFGSLSINGDGQWVYRTDSAKVDAASTAEADFFQVRVSDSSGVSQPYTVHFAINGVNDKPVLKASSGVQIDSGVGTGDPASIPAGAGTLLLNLIKFTGKSGTEGSGIVEITDPDNALAEMTIKFGNYSQAGAGTGTGNGWLFANFGSGWVHQSVEQAIPLVNGDTPTKVFFQQVSGSGPLTLLMKAADKGVDSESAASVTLTSSAPAIQSLPSGLLLDSGPDLFATGSSSLSTSPIASSALMPDFHASNDLFADAWRLHSL